MAGGFPIIQAYRPVSTPTIIASDSTPPTTSVCRDFAADLERRNQRGTGEKAHAESS